jgi:hypothetical protein
MLPDALILLSDAQDHASKVSLLAVANRLRGAVTLGRWFRRAL